MAVLFTDVASGAESRGRVQMLFRPGTDAPGSIVHAPEWGGFFEFKAIFTNITIAEGGNYQFQHMLGKHIYVHVFGDRIGQFGLSGIAFYDNCGQLAPEDDPFASAVRGKIGIANVIDYYRKMRLSARAEPLLITLEPDTVFKTFLLGMRGQVLNAAQRLFQFALQFALVPDE